MKKLLILSVVFFSFGFANAQVDSPKHEGFKKEKKGEMLIKMKEKLGLTDEQVKQIQAIDAKYEAQESELRAQGDKIKDQHKQIREAKKSEIEKILTADQKEKIKAWKESKGKKGTQKE